MSHLHSKPTDHEAGYAYAADPSGGGNVKPQEPGRTAKPIAEPLHIPCLLSVPNPETGRAAFEILLVNGCPRFVLYNAQGEPAVVVATDEEGASLEMLHRDDERLGLSVGPTHSSLFLWTMGRDGDNPSLGAALETRDGGGSLHLIHDPQFPAAAMRLGQPEVG